MLFYLGQQSVGSSIKDAAGYEQGMLLYRIG